MGIIQMFVWDLTCCHEFNIKMRISLMTKPFAIPIPNQGTFFRKVEKRALIGYGYFLWGCDAWFWGPPIRHYGCHSSGAGAEGASSTAVEAAEGCLP